MVISKIGSTIRDRRKELVIPQQVLAEIAGVSKNTIYKIERGQGNPTIKVLTDLLEVLGLEISIQPKSVDL